MSASSSMDIPELEQSASAKMSAGSLSMAWYGLVSAMFFIYIGASLAQAYGTIDTLIGLAITIVIYGSINRVLAGYALRSGLTVAQFSRTLLGRKGAVLATLVLAATAIYYAVFEEAILGYAFQAQFGGPIQLWYALVVLYTLPLIAGGIQRWLDKINGWLLPIYRGGLLTAVIWASITHPGGSSWLSHSTSSLPFSAGGPGWLATCAAFMGVWILMMYTVDFASLGRAKDVKIYQRFTFGWLFYTLAFGANSLIGIYLTFTIPGAEATETGVAGALVQLMGPLGLLVIFVSQTRINTANYALGISNLKEFGTRALGLKLPSRAWVFIGAVIIYLLMLLPVVQYLLLALSWQGALVTGWVSIALVHIRYEKRFALQPDSPNLPDRMFPAFNAAGVSAWVISAAVGIAMVQSGSAWGANLGVFITPVLAATIYAIWNPGARAKRHHDALASVKQL